MRHGSRKVQRGREKGKKRERRKGKEKAVKSHRGHLQALPMLLSSKKGPAGADLAVQPPERGREMGEKMAKRSRWLQPWRAKRHFCQPCAHRRQRVCSREVDMREPEWRTRSHLIAMSVSRSEDCPCSSHKLKYLLYIGEFVL